MTDNHRELLEQARSKALDELAEFGKAPDRYGLIHGDFLPDNLLRSDEAICLIDFDDAGFGWHLFDLTTSLFTHMDEEWYDDALGGLIEGYSSRRDLPDDHLARLPLFFVLRGFSYLSWMYTRRETETARLITPFLVEGMADLLGDYLGKD